MPTLSHCIVCGSKGIAVLYEATYKGDAAGASQYFLNQRSMVAKGRIVRCTDCGFVFTNPQFTSDEYKQIYAAAPRVNDAADRLAEAERLRFMWLAGLVQKYSGTDGRLFDFGCSDGKFLRIVSAREKVGHDVAHFSPDDSLAITILSGDFLSSVGRAPLLEQSFDSVTAWDVLEHLPDLDRYVGAMYRLLKPGGLLFVTLPNISSFAARATGHLWNMLLLEHLWYFTPNTFERFMAQRQFVHVAHGTTSFWFPISHFAERFAQTYGVDIRGIVKPIGKLIVTVPVGLMYAIYRRA